MVVHMYYLIMKTAVKPEVQSKTFCCCKIYIPIKKGDNCLIDFKFYQKLLVVLISLSTILIFPESPIKMEKICENYNSTKSCNVW